MTFHYRKFDRTKSDRPPASIIEVPLSDRRAQALRNDGVGHCMNWLARWLIWASRNAH